MTTNVKIYLSCNNPDNGNPQGYVESVQINVGSIEPALVLEGNRLKCRAYPTIYVLSLGHFKKIELLNYHTWVGNWCWNMATVSAKEAVKVVNYLKRRGWHCEGGWADMCDKWENEHVFVMDDFTEVSE